MGDRFSLRDLWICTRASDVSRADVPHKRNKVVLNLAGPARPRPAGDGL